MKDSADGRTSERCGDGPTDGETPVDALSRAMDTGGIGTWRWLPSEQRLDWDEAMIRLFGLEPGQFDGNVETWAGAVHRDDLDRVLDLLGTAIEQAEPFHLDHRVRRHDSEIRWLDGWGATVVDQDGALVGLVGYAEDVTERTIARRDREELLAKVTARAEAEQVQRERLELVAGVNQALERSGDLDDLAHQVAAAVVPKLADWCSVYVLPTEHDMVPNVAIWHRDPSMVAYAHELQTRWPYDPDAAAGVPHVIRTGDSDFYPEITDEMLDQADADPDQVDLVRRLRLNSAITVALCKADRIYGALQLVMTSEHRAYTDEDLTLAEAIAARIAATLENRRLRSLRDRVASIDAHLAELGRQLAAAPHLNDVLAVMNAELAAVLGADGARGGRVVDAEHLSIVKPGDGAGAAELLDLDTDDPMCEAATTGRLLRTTDDGAVMASPLYDDDRRSIGVICCTWDHPKVFDDVDQSAVETLSRLCGQSLRRSQLAGQTTALARLAAAMAAARTTEDLATVVRDYGTQSLQARATNLRVLDPDAGALNAIVPSGLDPLVDERYEEVELDDAAPAAEAARDDRAVLLPTIEDFREHFPTVVDDYRRAGVGAVAAIPLHRSDGQVEGVIAFAWPAAMRFDAALLTLLNAICDLAAQTLERVSLHEAEHDVVRSMQRRLLPPLPASKDLTIEAFYEPAAAAIGMGGDWYGAVTAPDGTFVAIIGDVVGHGVDAVAAMAQIQHLTTGLIRTGTPLSEVMARTNDMLDDGEGIYATAVLLHADPAQERFGYVNAGHPWPLLRLPDGSIRILNDQHHSLLGTTVEVEPLSYIPFPKGAMVFAYTDGLIERRDEPITDGIDRLVEVWTSLPPDHGIETLVTAARRHQDPIGAINDDAAGLLVRHTG